MLLDLSRARLKTPYCLASVVAAVLLSMDLVASQRGPRRLFTPEDLFRVQRVGLVAWSPDGQRATIELDQPGPFLDTVPDGALRLLDVSTHTLKPLGTPSASHLGFFNAQWSPDGRRVAFLSVDAKAMVRLWLWTAGTIAPRELPGLDVRTGPGDPSIAWIDGTRLAVMAWDRTARKSGLLYTRLMRGRNAADAWKVAVEGNRPSVSILESGGAPETTSASGQLVVLDLNSGTRTVLARGRLHRLSVSADGCCVSFLRENPGVPGQSVASYFERANAAGNADAAYTAVNWGTERHSVDARSGAEVALPTAARPQGSPTAAVPNSPPVPGANLLSAAPSGNAALYLTEGNDGSHLLLAGGAGRPLSASFEIWRANEWMSDIDLGRPERFEYRSLNGSPLTGWLLLPPRHVAGTRAPVVTIVYPAVYGQSPPSSFSAFRANFEHPQLFAALGYAVLLPSMPSPADPLESHALEPLLSGVLPALDAAIAGGAVDPDRIAVVGQSDGGFAVLGLITQTTRFRSAVASASFSNLVSLYGTLHGEFRHGDSGRPEAGQVLRMLQFEKGGMGLGGPPWARQDRYHTNSPILRADRVQTPLMLVHGDLDSIPIQQAEEFFTALLRQDKRAVLVRYGGEGHTISGRANVLDLWDRLEAWLADTMAARR